MLHIKCLPIDVLHGTPAVVVALDVAVDARVAVVAEALHEHNLGGKRAANNAVGTILGRHRIDIGALWGAVKSLKERKPVTNEGVS